MKLVNNKLEIDQLDSCSFCIKKECKLKDFIEKNKEFYVVVMKCSEIEIQYGR